MELELGFAELAEKVEVLGFEWEPMGLAKEELRKSAEVVEGEEAD